MSETSSAVSLFDKSRRPFLLRKLHSLSGVIPVGGFLCFHLWENARALQGQEQFDEAVSGIGHMPYVTALEAVILLPLFFHALFGLKLVFDPKYNVGRFTYSRNWMYTLQRITGVLALVFIAGHLWEYRIQKARNELAPEQFFQTLCSHMSWTVGNVPVIGLAYILGIAACAFHFANGLWGFCFSWGITVSRRSQQLSATAFGVLGIILFILGANTAIYFTTGAGILQSRPVGASDSMHHCPAGPAKVSAVH